jgi:hypothetical protein
MTVVSSVKQSARPTTILKLMEALMEHSTGNTSSDIFDADSERHYRELLEKSESARNEGDHWAAQKFATQAHKWAMDERTRLQRLAQARKALETAERRLTTCWDKDRECATVDELHEKHPEFRSVITNCEKARQLVIELESAPVDAEVSNSK